MEDIHYGIKNIIETYDDDVLIEKSLTVRKLTAVYLGKTVRKLWLCLDVKKATHWIFI